MEFDRLLQRLRARLGEEAVIHPELVESYLPERAWRPAGNDGATSATTVTAPVISHRPLSLFQMPLEIQVVCEPSDERTGDPRQFSWQHHVHRLVHVVGPNASPANGGAAIGTRGITTTWRTTPADDSGSSACSPCNRSIG